MERQSCSHLHPVPLNDMPDLDDQRAALSAIAASLPLAISSPTSFPLSSLDEPLRTLLSHSRSSLHLSHLSSDLLSIHQSPDFVSFVLPLFLSSALTLDPSSTLSPSSPPSVLSIERLWRLLRNHCCTPPAQHALLTSSALPPFLSALSLLSSVPSTPPSLLLTGGQLLANALTSHPTNQLHFLSYVLSPLFLHLLHTPSLPFRASLLHSLHLSLLPPSSQVSFLSHPLSLLILTAAFTPPSEEEEGAADCELFAQAILTRFFIHQAAFLPSLLPALSPSQSSPLSSAAIEWLLQGLEGVEVDASEAVAASLTSNCLALLTFLCSSLPSLPPSLVDDSTGYLSLPSYSLPSWTPLCLSVVEHCTSSLLSHPTHPLITALSSTPTRILLLSLLHSKPLPELHTCLLRLLSSLCALEGESGVTTPFPVLHALSFLGHTHIDETQPLQREYSVIGLRAVCSHERVREVLAGLKGMEVEGGSEWRARGVDVQWDEEREG